MNTINKLLAGAIFLSIILVLALIMPNTIQAQYYGCSNHYSQKCSGSSLYWYDSCGNQQDIVQYCANGCYNSTCLNYNNYNNYNYNNYNYNNYGNCTYHAYRLCSGNSSFWYDSCGTIQDLYINCTSGQTCQYGQCVAFISNPVLPPIQPISNYVANYKTSCYGNAVHWFDSFGAESGLQKNCNDSNACTIDSCSVSSCVNTLKCDGSTCATGSAEYNTYCSASQPTQPVQPIAPVVATTNNLVLSFFAKQDVKSTQWQKTAQLSANSPVYFMITATNNSATQIDNVVISANIPTEIFSLGNLQLNGTPITGDIVSGINIGSIAPSTTKPITFEGKTQADLISAEKKGLATSNVSGAVQSDSVSISFITNPSVAAVSSTQPSGFMEFLKKWYMWILTGLVLIFLFVVVFKRLSSET